jgi:Lrp/AsnC family transcriptional regulator
MPHMLDRIDRKILDILQRKADLPISDIAEKVGLSPTPCWRRIKRMEEDGIIRQRVALIDRKKANVSTTVFMTVKAPRHQVEWLDAFKRVIGKFPEITEAYRLTGDADYLLRIVVPDIEAYDEVYKRLITQLDFSDITSSIAMEEMKFTTAIPTDYM